MVAIAGPTGVGKSAVALDLAETVGVEVVSCDAMQVYRGMDIGTAKPSRVDRERLRHYCIDIVDPTEEYSAACYQRDAREAISAVGAKKLLPLLVGGSGLYLKAAIDDVEFPPAASPQRRRELEAMPLDELVAALRRLDPARAGSVDLANQRRVVRAIEIADQRGPQGGQASTLEGRSGEGRSGAVRARFDLDLFVIAPLDRQALYGDVDRRVDRMISAGWLDEVAALRSKYSTLSKTAGGAIGYRQLRQVLDGEIDLDQATTSIKSRTHSFVRRQLTWFRAESRATWLSGSIAEISGSIRSHLDSHARI